MIHPGWAIPIIALGYVLVGVLVDVYRHSRDVRSMRAFRRYRRALRGATATVGAPTRRQTW